MREIIREISKLLKEGMYKDEQHIRFSVVGRICQQLGWNIWNPTEFYTEYPVKKYPSHEVTADLRGRVDVALILTDKRTDIAEVFIEVKAPGKLRSELPAGELQLQKYNFWDKSAISILTDGIIWRFYLPSIGGAFDNSLFNQIDLLNDDLDTICTVFEQILKRDNFRKKALHAAECMHEQLYHIMLVSAEKQEAIQIGDKTGISPYLITKQLLSRNRHIELNVDYIEELWNRSAPELKEPEKPYYFEPEEQKSISDHRDTNVILPNDYRFMRIKYVVIAGNEPIQLKYWFQLKFAVYNYIIHTHPDVVITGAYRYSKNKAEYRSHLELNNGFFTERNLSSSDIVRHCRKALKIAGLDPIRDLVIGIERTE